MTWLFPLYLAGAAAVIAPILLHLRRRPPQKRVEFSSLMFLEQTPLVTTTRSRIERWLLLLLRCLALLLLAVMFSRPFMQSQATTATHGRAIALLIDRSASMQHSNQWSRALTKARDVLGTLQPQDRVVIATFDKKLQILAGFERTRDRSASERVAMLAPAQCGWLGTDLGKAMIEAVNALGEAREAATRLIIVISDFQEGAAIESLRGFAWPDGVAVRPEVIAPIDSNNLSLSLVAGEAASTSGAKLSNALRVRVANARDASNDRFALHWDQEPAPAIEGHLSAGASRVVRLPRPADAKPHVLRVSGDGWSFDNELHIAPAQPLETTIVALPGNEPPSSVESPVYYLERALQPTTTLAPKITVIEKPDAVWPARPAVAICTSSSDPRTAPVLKRWIDEGGLAICAVTGTASAFIEAATGKTIQLSEASVKDYALLAEFDHAHPLLRPFADVRLRDFTKIHFWHHRTLTSPDLQSEVIARFDNGSPAWIVVTQGKGRLLLMLSGWHPRDSQLALSSKFVPLLFGFLQEAGVAMDQPTQYQTGDSLPEGSSDKPGLITTKAGRQLAVNLPPEESRVARMDLSRLTTLGARLESQVAATLTATDRARLANEEIESRQQYWLLALIALLVVLALETWLAGRRQTARTAGAGA